MLTLLKMDSAEHTLDKSKVFERQNMVQDRWEYVHIAAKSGQPKIQKNMWTD